MHKGNTHQPRRHVLDRKSSTIPKVPVPRNLVSNAFEIENFPMHESLPWWNSLEVPDEMIGSEDLEALRELESGYNGDHK